MKALKQTSLGSRNAKITLASGNTAKGQSIMCPGMAAIRRDRCPRDFQRGVHVSPLRQAHGEPRQSRTVALAPLKSFGREPISDGEQTGPTSLRTVTDTDISCLIKVPAVHFGD
jgi:hypothetical protein